MSSPSLDEQRRLLGSNIPPWPTLTQEQQRLLMTALITGRSSGDARPSPSARSSSMATALSQASALPPDMFAKSTASFDDYAIGSDPFDFTGLQDGNAAEKPTSLSKAEVNLFDAEFGEKRKSPEDDDDDDDDGSVDHKRRDSGDDKILKKPGRKPITTEPTTKRKAQNRAAQRAFRERKEKHLKDLETKVQELEKTSVADKEENSLLKAQVERLQSEVRDYKKRMSLAAGSSPPRSAEEPSSSTFASNFDFDFTPFGLPGHAPSTSRSSHRHDSLSQSPHTTVSSKSLSPHFDRSGTQPGDSTYGLFGINTNPYSFAESKTADGRPTHFYDNNHQNSVDSRSSYSSAGSPSGDSQKAPTCSSCTSPGTDDFSTGKNSDTPDFGKYSLGGRPSVSPPEQLAPKTPDLSDLTGFDWFASQNGGQFDPVLFGGYRESQDAVVGDGDFSSGLFEDPLSLDLDNGDPFNVAMQAKEPCSTTDNVSSDLMRQVETQKEGHQYDQPAGQQAEDKDHSHKMWTAQKVWSTIRDCPKFQQGDFDLDDLCAELKAKAVCSETGMSIPEKHVKDALWRLAGSTEN